MGVEVEQTLVDLIRHGEHQLGTVVCGVTDPELTAAGRARLHRRIHTLRQHGAAWERCLSSPKKRCAGFARQLAAEQGIEYAEEPGFAEVDFGCWETLAYEQIERDHPGQWQQWVDNPRAPAPHGGERYGDFLHRIEHAWARLVAQHRGRKIILFAHGGVIRAVLYSVLSLPSAALNRFHIPLGSHTRIRVYHAPDKPDMVQLDRHNTY